MLTPEQLWDIYKEAFNESKKLGANPDTRHMDGICAIQDAVLADHAALSAA